MSGKPITSDLEPAPPDTAATAGILADLRAGGAAGGEAGEGGPALGDLSAAKPKRRISIQTLVLVGVLATSSGLLYVMRMRGKNAGVHFDKMPSIAVEIEKIRKTDSASERRIFQDLADVSRQQETELERLRKNPFRLDAPEGAMHAMPGTDPAAVRLAEIRERFKGIKLNSVMQGRVPVAIINERMVRVGDLVEEYFLVAQIHDRSVDLIADGRTYSLNMSDAPAPGGGRPPQRQPTRR
jgi:hypothetical protein